MIYLLVNHIAARPGKAPGELAFPRAWHDDLIAQASALSLYNIRLMVATPFEDREPTSDAVSITPDFCGFEHLPIPGYKSARQFLRARTALTESLNDAIDTADVVQFDIGGHPVTPAVLGEPIARLRHKPFVWVFGSESPIPALRRINSDRRATKRLAGLGLNLRMESFLRASIRYSRLIFTHGPHVLDELRSRNSPIHQIERLSFSDRNLMNAEAVQARRAQLLDNSKPLIFQVKTGKTVSTWVDHSLRAIAHVTRLHVSARLHLVVDQGDLKSVWSKVIEMKLKKLVTIDTRVLPRSDVDLEPSALAAEDSDLTSSVAHGRVPIAYRSGSKDGLGSSVVRVKRHDELGLANAMLEASVDRPALVRRMLDGIAFVKARTLEASHRRRAAIIHQSFFPKISRVA